MVEIQILTKERIFELLRNQIKSKEIASITELEQSAQLVRSTKRFYKLDLNTGSAIHLTITNQCSRTFEKTKAFNSLFPDISCKPIFFETIESYQLFAQEFFEGNPIHELLDKGILNHQDVDKILNEINDKFNDKIIESTTDSWEAEIAELSSIVLETLETKDKKIV